MYTLIKKYIREDITIPFFNECTPTTTEYRELMKTKYIDTKKILKATNELSSDGKVLTTTIIWSTSDDFLDSIKDDSCISAYIRKQHIYNLKNNIRIETISIRE
jgi:hypothetical protein